MFLFSYFILGLCWFQFETKVTTLASILVIFETETAKYSFNSINQCSFIKSGSFYSVELFVP